MCDYLLRIFGIIKHKIHCMIFPYDYLFSNFEKLKHGLTAFSVNENNRQIILKGSKLGLITHYKRLFEELQEYVNGPLDHFHLDEDTFYSSEGYAIPLLTDDSLPALVLYTDKVHYIDRQGINDEDEELICGKIDFRYIQETGIIIESTKENLKVFSTTILDYLSKKSIIDEIVLNDTIIGDRIWTSRNSWKFFIKIEEGYK